MTMSNDLYCVDGLAHTLHLGVTVQKRGSHSTKARATIPGRFPGATPPDAPASRQGGAAGVRCVGNRLRRHQIDLYRVTPHLIAKRKSRP